MKSATYITLVSNSGGHRIRGQVADDELLANLLRRVLPKYEGDKVTVYRGENLERWNAGQLGFSWTEKIEVARMFGQGLNATRTGGLLLKGYFAPDSIICGPNKHSAYLQEHQFTIDPSFYKEIQVIERYPPL